MSGWAGAASAVMATGTGTSPSGGGGATHADNGSGTSVSSLQIQAQELAGEITADGRTLDELDAAYQAAELNYAKLSAHQQQLQRAMAAATAAATTARQELKNQALLAYLAGGAPLISYLPDRPGLDPSLTAAYAEIVTGGQKAAVQAYRATLDTETHEKVALDANARQVAATLASIKSDSAQAATTLTSQRHALSQVKGQLAVEVAKVEQQQQAAEQAREQASLAASGQLPGSAGAASAGAGSTASGARRPASPSDQPATKSPRLQPTGQAAQPTRQPATQPTVQPTTKPTNPPATKPTTAPPTSASPPAPSGQSDAGSNPSQAPGVDAVLSYARAQVGKPYQWAAAGPDSFDCSGLVMMAWQQAGIYFPHLAQDQYALTARIPLSALIPGDLVFFGTPDDVHHVGIYVGSGDMIDAPETGQNVQVQSIYWDSLLGAGRVTSSS